MNVGDAGAGDDELRHGPDLAERNDPDLLLLVETAITDFAAPMAMLGVTCEMAAPRHVRLRLPFSREAANHLGVIDAAVVVAFAQFAGTALLWCSLPRGVVPYASGVTTAGVRPVRQDLVVDAKMPTGQADRIAAEIVAEPHAAQRVTLTVGTDDTDAPPVVRAALTYRFVWTGISDAPRL